MRSSRTAVKRMKNKRMNKRMFRILTVVFGVAALLLIGETVNSLHGSGVFAKAESKTIQSQKMRGGHNKAPATSAQQPAKANGQSAGAGTSQTTGSPSSAASAQGNATSGSTSSTTAAAQPAQPTTQQQTQSPTTPGSASVSVPVQSQEPELYNGCEVTSLSMLMTAAGNPVSKMTLADNVPKDPTGETQDANGNTTYWGDPNRGFVGDVTGTNRGYGVYHGPIFQLAQQYLGNRAVDLTGSTFAGILHKIAAGKAVEVWTTVNFTPPTDWTTWNTPDGPVKASFSEHAVLLVGYDANTVTLNDPLDGTQKSVDRSSFAQSWVDMGRQAVSYN